MCFFFPKNSAKNSACSFWRYFWALFFFCFKSRGPKVEDPSFESRGYEKKEARGRSAAVVHYSEPQENYILYNLNL